MAADRRRAGGIPGTMHRARGFLAACTGLAVATAGVSFGEEEAYTSPYGVEFRRPAAELIGDLLSGPRGDAHGESTEPFAEWSRGRHDAWGPRPRLYPPPREVEGRPAEWRRERVLAAALRFVGYRYRHHHIPDWDAPASPGHPGGKGIDCSNLTAFVYNQALGIHLNSGIAEQSRAERASSLGPGHVRARRIDKSGDYESWCAGLRTGDLVFVRKDGGQVAHVVLWAGPVGRSPDGVPLILDSHGEDVKDSDGRPIPEGVHLRPYRKNSWYFGSTSHALRLIDD